MRYMMLIKATEGYEAGAPPNAALMAGMAKLGEAEVGIEIRRLAGGPPSGPAR